MPPLLNDGKSITVLCGGVGAARFLRGLVEIAEPEGVVAVVNVGDDELIYGFHVSPDIDTVLYSLAGRFDDDRGFGIRGDTFAWLDAMGALGEDAWFRIGDRDLATHVYRSRRLREGAPLSTVTAELAAAFGVAVRVVPATDDRLRTAIETDDGVLAFQDYFVRRRWQPAVRAIGFEGADGARPAPGVVAAIERADIVIIAPSNPLISIGPIVAVDGVRDALAARRERVVAICPLVQGRAIKGPAAAMMASLGHRVDAVGVAALYRDIAGTLIIDDADAGLAAEVERAGTRAVVAPTLMIDGERRRNLARATLAIAERAWAS